MTPTFDTIAHRQSKALSGYGGAALSNCVALVSLLIAALLPPAFAAETASVPIIPVESFFKTAQFDGASVSPNGKYFAFRNSDGGRTQLAVIDLETHVIKLCAAFSDSDVYAVHWVNNERLVFNAIDRTSKENSHASGLFAVNRDGSGLKALTPTRRVQEDVIEIKGIGNLYWSHFESTYRNDAGDIVTSELRAEGDDITANKVNTVTGRKKELLMGVKGTPTDFVLDNNQVIRLVSVYAKGEKSRILYYRDDESQSWKVLTEVETKDPAFHVLAFDADNKTLYVSAWAKSGKRAIYKYDFEKNAIGDQVAADADVDVDGYLCFDSDHRLIGIRVYSEPPKTLWLDPAYAKVQSELDAALTDWVNVIMPGDIKSKVVVYSYSPTNPGKYSIYDTVTHKLTGMFAGMPWVKPAQMSDQLLFNYAARDGLNIPAYLTIPLGKPMKSLPLIVLVHAGPWQRDHWKFAPDVQFLANRGYAVLQPEFRGSAGFGESHFKKGFGQWGLAMQDDITDGVLNLIKQGVVDGKRVCIMGQDYGGYAALMGLVKEPSLFRCAIDLFGPTDIDYLFSKSQWMWQDTWNYSLKNLIGDPTEKEEQFIATSPLQQAAKIHAPVLMVYGTNDWQVPLIHGEKIRAALEKNGTPVEFMELKEEEHGLALDADRYKVYGAIEKFLKTYNPVN